MESCEDAILHKQLTELQAACQAGDIARVEAAVECLSHPLISIVLAEAFGATFDDFLNVCSSKCCMNNERV